MDDNYKQADTASIDERAVLAARDRAEAERLIEEFKPFLRSCVARYSPRSDYMREELFSAAMIAFYEAITSYKSEKGRFLSFAGTVVRRRLIDAMRNSYRAAGDTVPLEVEDEDDAPVLTNAVRLVSMRNYEADTQRRNLAGEIEQLRAELADWGITMDALVKQSPKHVKLREAYREMVDIIAGDPEIMQTILLRRYLPVKKIAELTDVPLKKVERARTFILASVIIKTGDYEQLAAYVTG